MTTETITRCDLALVGGGIAGLYAALCVGDEADVLLLSKGPLRSSASYLAQGGVAAAEADDDSPELHAEDTMRAGRGLCRESAVRALVGEAPARVADLRDLGVPFDPEPGLEGGHSRRRVLHVAGAATGKEILRVLVDRVLEHPRIRVSEGETVRAISAAGGRCSGVVSDRRSIEARATLIATGGAASLWQRTTNPPGATGDGMAMAFRAGARLADLEFMQFHPTVLAENGLLLSEALRGEGAVLVDADGRRFTDELAPRDVVARAVGERGNRPARPAPHRPRPLSGAHGRARAGGLRPCAGADSRLPGGALHDGRHRHGSRRPNGRGGPLRGGRVRLHRRPRREPPGVELPARVPRLRPPRRPRRPHRRPKRTCPRDSPRDSH